MPSLEDFFPSEIYVPEHGENFLTWKVHDNPVPLSATFVEGVASDEVTNALSSAVPAFENSEYNL